MRLGGAVVSLEGRSVAPAGWPSSVFDLWKQETTLTEADFDEECSKNPQWPNLAPGKIESYGVWRWRPRGGDRMSSAWLSLLAPPGSAIVNAKEGTCHLVLSVSRIDFLSWRTPVQKDRRLVFATIPNRSVQFF